ncbi:PstS family phosphate ABC transporter substrate-binding protein [Chitinophaga sp.]|uniref:PstS family phosphate ABC transporter substrate-binding protein n=1 Tax=Chitinophaga sp. TaxID=1869181 RepID=UPI0031E02342
MKYSFLILAIVLLSCSGNKTVKVKGSDTEVNLAVQFAEAFHRYKPSLFVSVSGGGSGLGIASLLNGTADIANASRRINDKELALFREKGIALDSFIFAQDAIAFIVSDDLPLASISTRQLADVLSGKARNWEQITGKRLPVNIYGRQSNSGTHDFVKDRLHISFSPQAKQMNGNAQILEAIRADHSGIGYVGAGYVIHGANRGIKVLPVYTTDKAAAVSPLDAAKIAAGKYFFQRPLFQYFRAKDSIQVRPFIAFEQSPEGQKIINVGGYYPAKK